MARSIPILKTLSLCSLLLYTILGISLEIGRDQIQGHPSQSEPISRKLEKRPHGIGWHSNGVFYPSLNSRLCVNEYGNPNLADCLAITERLRDEPDNARPINRYFGFRDFIPEQQPSNVWLPIQESFGQ